MAMARAGGYLPPIEAYLADEGRADNAPAVHPYAAPRGPMSEEEAMEYLVMKDIPPAVWRDYRGNEQILVICRKEQIPNNQTFRNSWIMKESV
jgi:hypothetical protein